QLAQNVPALRPFIYRSVSGNPDISERGLGEQWRTLILQPFSSLKETPPPRPSVIVIDALDECDREDDIQLILRLFSEGNYLWRAVNLKFFVARGFDSKEFPYASSV